MSKQILALAASTIFAISPAFAGQASSGSTSPKATGASGTNRSSAAAPTTQPAPEGFVMLEEDVVYMTADQPEEHLVRAHEDLAKNNTKAAASELRLAAGYIRMQELRPGTGKQVLEPWSNELRTLADQVAEGKAKQQDVLKASGGVSYALAKFFDQRAINELQKNKEVQAGYALRAAAGDFEQALIWAEQKPQDSEAKVIADAKNESEKLIDAEDESQQKPGQAQPAASKVGPSNGGSGQECEKCADALLKSIDSVSNKFTPAASAQAAK